MRWKMKKMICIEQPKMQKKHLFLVLGFGFWEGGWGTGGRPGRNKIPSFSKNPVGELPYAWLGCLTSQQKYQTSYLTKWATTSLNNTKVGRIHHLVFHIWFLLFICLSKCLWRQAADILQARFCINRCGFRARKWWCNRKYSEDAIS